MLTPISLWWREGHENRVKSFGWFVVNGCRFLVTVQPNYVNGRLKRIFFLCCIIN